MCSDRAVGVQIMGKDWQNHSSYCKSVHESTTTSRGHDRELPQVESPFFACDVIADITHCLMRLFQSTVRMHPQRRPTPAYEHFWQRAKAPFGRQTKDSFESQLTLNSSTFFTESTYKHFSHRLETLSCVQDDWQLVPPLGKYVKAKTRNKTSPWRPGLHRDAQNRFRRWRKRVRCRAPPRRTSCELYFTQVSLEHVQNNDRFLLFEFQ